MKSVCTIFLLIAFQFSFAQTYHPFPDTGANWSEYSYVYGAEVGGYYSINYDGHLYALGDDTIINSLKYTKVGFNSTWYYGSANGQPGNYYIPTVVLPGPIIGGIREDSSKKIWFLDMPVDTERLLYDFNLEIGDTIKWGIYSPKYGQCRVVLSIDSVKLNDGTYRKRFLFNNETPPGSDYIVEGIGSSLGLFGMYDWPPDYGAYEYNLLVCFSQGNENLFDISYPQNIVSCNLTHIAPVGINYVSNTDGVSVFPNPTQDKVNIDFDNTTHHIIQITNPLGQALFKTDSYNKNYEMDISFLANGIYFISVTNDEKKTFVKKLIKM